MKIVFDLDGVLRDLNTYVSQRYKCAYPNKWEYKYNGKSIFECIDEDITILEKAPATGYKSIVKAHYQHVEIWTSQPEHWRVYTMQWINKHLGTGSVVHFLTTEEKEAKLSKEEDTVLIEDSPKFISYDNILLIDRPYNQSVKGAIRIFGSKHLNNMIEVIKGKI